MKRFLHHPAIFYGSVAAASVLILFSRKPDAFRNPQFWAEDGRNWYADAYNHSFLQTLVTAEAGYFQTFSRIIAGAAQFFPVSAGPLFFNFAAVMLQAGVAVFISSDRMRPLIPARHYRVLLAFFYLAMPHAWEVFGNLTNSQWHLALLACLILISEVPESRPGRILDIAVVAISALSGPFCLLLFPISAFRYVVSRSRHILILAATLAAGCVVQGISLLSSTRDVQSDLGASVPLLFQMIARHVALGPIVGIRGFYRIQRDLGWSDAAAAAVSIAAIAAAIFIAYRASTELRMLMIYAILVIIAAFGWPAVTLEPGQWRVIASNDTAMRYWFVPTFALYSAAFFFLSRVEFKWPRFAAAGLVAICLAGVYGDWRIPPLKDYEFQRYAAEFETVPEGTPFEIPVNPDWKMTLIKK